MFRSDYDAEGTYENEEDQMMEDFVYGVAARHLGVEIHGDNSDDLRYDTPFRKYKKTIIPANSFLGRLRRKLGL